MDVDNKFSAKYLDGWGDIENSKPIPKDKKRSFDQLFNQFSKKDQEFFRNMWRTRYLGMMERLLDEELQQVALNDGYLRRIEGN